MNDIYGDITRRILPPLFIAYVIAYLDRVNVGFAKLEMLTALHFSESTYGLGAGLFFIGYFLFGVPANIMLHRIGARRWLAGIMVFWGVTSAASIFISTPGEFYALRLLLGAAEAGFFPGVIFHLTQWYPAARRAKVNALFMSAVAVCGAAGSLLSGWIMQTFDGRAHLPGWQWLFLLEALPAILMGMYLGVRLDDDAQRVSWLSADAKRKLARELADEVVGRGSSGAMAAVLRDGRIWLIALIYFCLVTGLYGISFWLPTIVSEMGIDQPARVGALAAVPYAAAAVCMVYLGRDSDRKNERRWHVAIPAALGAGALMVSALCRAHGVVEMASLILATSGILSAVPLVWSLPRGESAGASSAVAIALINSFGNLAGFVSPYAVGWIKDLSGSTADGLYLIACTILVGAIIVATSSGRAARCDSLIHDP